MKGIYKFLLVLLNFYIPTYFTSDPLLTPTSVLSSPLNLSLLQLKISDHTQLACYIIMTHTFIGLNITQSFFRASSCSSNWDLASSVLGTTLWGFQ